MYVQQLSVIQERCLIRSRSNNQTDEEARRGIREEKNWLDLHVIEPKKGVRAALGRDVWPKPTCLQMSYNMKFGKSCVHMYIHILNRTI